MNLIHRLIVLVWFRWNPKRLGLVGLSGCLGVAMMTTGCDQTSVGPQTVQSPSGSKDNLSAEQIVRRMRAAYLAAGQYEDQATLHLSYQLEGRFMEEPHLWSVEYQRPNRLKARVYNVRVSADSEQLGCFIYEFGSGNLDNQWMVHAVEERLPLRKLFDDQICRHYLTGQTELPVNSRLTGADQALFPPTIGMLTDQTPVHWLDGQATRLADVQLNQSDCFQIQFRHNQLEYVALIDKREYLLRQLQYPNQLLDQRLQNNHAIRNLSLVARFHDAQFECVREPGHFQVTIPGEAKVVSNFVAVPEPFPSASIGKPIGPLGLREIDATLVRQNQWMGKVTLLAWLSDSTQDQEFAQNLMRVARQLPPKEYQFAQVVVIENGLPTDAHVQSLLKSRGREFDQALYADFGFAGGTSLNLESYPAVAVIDRQGVLQFVKSLHDIPLTDAEIRDVLLRVRSGDDVAGEMRQKYEEFLNDYQKRLDAATKNKLESQPENQLVAASLPDAIGVRRRWSVNQLKQPGNIAKGARNSEILVVDGWRTIVQVNRTGAITKRRELPLGPRQSINVLRGGQITGQNTWAVYSVMGSEIHQLDSQLNKSREYNGFSDRSGNANQRRIQDAQWCDFDQDGNDELIVAPTEQGGIEVWQSSGDRQRLVGGQFRSLANIVDEQGGFLLVCNQRNELQTVATDSGSAKTVVTELTAVTHVMSRQAANGTIRYCVLGTDSQGRWRACGLDQTLKPMWSTTIGSQRFNTQIQSTCFALNDQGTGLWAIAGSDGRLTFVRDDGSLIDNWDVGREIHGVQLVDDGSQFLVFISTENRFECWEASLPSIPATNTSHRK